MADEPYRVEPAKSGRSTCKASKLPIEKGELRFGSFVDMGGHGSYHWRKLEYISDKQVANVEKKMGGVSHIGGYAALTSAQQKKLEKACAAATKKGAAKDKAKAKGLAAKAKAKLAKEKAKAAKAKAKAKIKEMKDKAKAKKEAKKATAGAKVSAKTAAKPAVKAIVPAKRAAAAAPAKAENLPPTKMQHDFLDAAKFSDFKKVRLMLEETPALINVQPAGRWSALHQAAHAGKPTAVKMLLGKGASLSLLNKEKQTPHDVAHANCTALVATAAKRGA